MRGVRYSSLTGSFCDNIFKRLVEALYYRLRGIVQILALLGCLLANQSGSAHSVYCTQVSYSAATIDLRVRFVDQLPSLQSQSHGIRIDAQCICTFSKRFFVFEEIKVDRCVRSSLIGYSTCLHCTLRYCAVVAHSPIHTNSLLQSNHISQSLTTKTCGRVLRALCFSPLPPLLHTALLFYS